MLCRIHFCALALTLLGSGSASAHRRFSLGIQSASQASRNQHDPHELVSAIEQHGTTLGSDYLKDVAKFQAARFASPIAFSGESHAWTISSPEYRVALGGAIDFVTKVFAQNRSRPPRWLRDLINQDAASPKDGADLVTKYLRTTWKAGNDSGILFDEARDRWAVYGKMPLAPTPIITGASVSDEELVLGILYGGHPVGLTLAADFRDPGRKKGLVGDESFIQDPTHMVVHDLGHADSLAGRLQPVFSLGTLATLATRGTLATRNTLADKQAMYLSKIADGIALGDYLMQALSALSPAEQKVAYTFLAKAAQASDGSAKGLARGLTESTMIERSDDISLNRVDDVRGQLDQLLKQYK